MLKQSLALIALLGLAGLNANLAPAAEWKPVFEDDFKHSLFADWEPREGGWDVRDHLRADTSLYRKGAMIMCTRQLQAPFRIEYECSSSLPADLTVLLKDGLDGKTVCFVAFGDEENTITQIKVAGIGPVAVSKDKLIELNRKHNVVVEVGEDGLVKQSIDGKEILKATVKNLLKKMCFGFYVWGKGAFHSVKVFSPYPATSATAAEEKK